MASAGQPCVKLLPDAFIRDAEDTSGFAGRDFLRNGRARPEVKPPVAAPAVMPAVSPRAAAAAPADISTAPASAPPLTLLPVDYLQRISARPQPSAGYQLIDEIGRGGMGIVYLARARSTNGSWR